MAIEANDGKPLPLYQKALCGLSAGAIGSSIGSPTNLALIRMQADATLPLEQRRHYKNVFHALYCIVADEGEQVLFRDSSLQLAICPLTGKYPYTGSLDCALKTLKAGGPLKFYIGFPVYCVKIAPHVMMAWIFLNQIQKASKKLGW
ncbi:hypothetical protein IFM89_007848 [Coptis chinensis]|uniref:Uncharacterized protein n=1 Tax=Coptis chinensis TaxID=261450 RepID=A0A835LDU7_9MAGN|nr:hypothetical protein IFM89_007848 [Coptis chinensis]